MHGGWGAVEEAEGWGSEGEEDEEDYEDDLEEEAAWSERDLQEAVRKLEVHVAVSIYNKTDWAMLAHVRCCCC
jgi:hypothetical protein